LYIYQHTALSTGYNHVCADMTSGFSHTRAQAGLRVYGRLSYSLFQIWWKSVEMLYCERNTRFAKTGSHSPRM